jgi:hypothetical protein
MKKSLTIRTSTFNELKSLGIYNKWISIVIAQWDSFPENDIIKNVNTLDLKSLLLHGFNWAFSKEGILYWSEIYHDQQL